MGFNLTRSIAKYAEVAVATHGFFKDAIDRAGGLGEAEPVYLDLEAQAARVTAISQKFKLAAAGSTLVHYPLSITFERELWKRMEHDLKAGRFDLVHRITPQSSALPSAIASLSPVPFVIGPINGSLAYPRQFQDLLWKEREWIRYVRSFYRFLPYVKRTYSRAAAILASGQHTIGSLPIRDLSRVFNMQELGFDPAIFYPPRDRSASERLTFLFVGRLVPFKCVRVAIDAFDSPLLRRHRLLIVGTGPEQEDLREQVRRLRLEETVEFAGGRPADQVAELMRSSDVFVFPSIRESGGLVVIEAMASGLACVVADHGGPGISVTEETGIKVPIGSPKEMAVRFREKLEQLVLDPVRRRSLGDSAARRMRERYTWDARGKIIHEIYRWVLGQRPDKPDVTRIVGEPESSLLSDVT